MSDSKIILHERDIAQITVYEKDMEVRYTKINKEDTIYHMTYSYDNIQEGKSFCPFCGEVFEVQNEEEVICPACEFNDRKYIMADDVPELIYSSLKEGSKVIVNVIGGKNFILEK